VPVKKAARTVDLRKLHRSATDEIDRYVYEYPPGVVGYAWSAEKVSQHLAEMRAALIDPYWADVVRRDTPEQMKSLVPPVERCVVVADDRQRYVLMFDPGAKTYLLAEKREGRLESFGIVGDAVGCFMAR
jgi:hypothetical protein